MKTDNPEENGSAIDESVLTEQQVDVQVLRNRDFPLVGIGGSAGAFGAFGEFFASVPPDSGAAFVVVQHLDPSVKSMLPELLQRHTSMPVVRVKDGMPVAPNHIYVIPENTEMALFGGRLLLLKPSRPRGLRMPIDTFFQSLAADWGEKAVAIIFSGMGTDGELGARFVKQGLGLVIAQRLDTAEYESMPRTIIDSGLADYVEAPGQMAPQLFEFLKRPYRNMQHKDAFTSPKVANALHKVLLLLRGQTGHDFSLYKKNTLFRRLERRMNTLQLESLEEYVTYLQHNQEEVKVLFKDFLIGVTRFFRDYPAFQLLEEKILPELLGKK
ncbi:MAG: Multidomain signal transduction protein including CheB-like methylesterase, CheR-like methyltransferase and BaeS-like histidine kinase, partial [uncultured Cytophagales bacterium]